MKNFFISFTLFITLIFVVSCGGSSKTNDTTDTGETVTDEDTVDTEPTEDQDTGESDTEPSEQTKEGIYLGIIGFNEALYTKDIDLLNKSTVNSYQNFIDKLNTGDGTGLYFADYTALEKLREYPVPPKLKNVALVTFTDGLDNISLANDDYNPGNYNSTAAYSDALHNMIANEKIHGLNVEAYTIGLKGKDVTDDAKFEETLKKLASSDGNVFQVSDMNEAKERFAAIAEALYSVSKTSNLDVKVPGGYDDGQLLRFTFDNPSAATDSTLYIEATYRRSNGRTLEKITYHGLAKGQTKISSVSSEGAYYHFVFENLKYAGGDTPLSQEDIKKIMLWKATSTGGWDKESEFNPESSSTIKEEKSSALIMLVLDCTTSLGSDFSRMKQAGKDFVTTLVNGENNSGNNEESGKCNLDSSILQGTAESYFAYKGTGKIQNSSASSYDWNSKSSVTVRFDGIPGKTKEVADSYSFFGRYTTSNSNNKEGIAIVVKDNPDNKNYFTSYIEADIPISWITDELIVENRFEMTKPPYIWFHDYTFTSDHVYLKDCIIAANKVGYNSDFGYDTRIGKLQVCYEDNDDFSVGETFKVAFFAELITDPNELVNYFSDTDSVEDLCSCYKMEDWSVVDCSEISLE